MGKDYMSLTEKILLLSVSVTTAACLYSVFPYQELADKEPVVDYKNEDKLEKDDNLENKRGNSLDSRLERYNRWGIKLV